MLGSLDHVTRQLIVHTSPTKRSSDFIAYLEQLDRLFGPQPGRQAKPVVLVEDNGPIHTSKRSLAALAARAHWLTVEWLPKYAPELNEIEPVSKLNILVNNAGAAWGSEIEAFPEGGWDKVMDLNVKAPFFLVQALLGALRAGASAARPAKVINIASIDGLSVNMQPTYSYSASKAGLIHLTKRLALELAPQHIVVSAIAPGAFASNMNKLARDKGDTLAKQIPSRRIGTPEDMAGAAIFLASRAGDYVVGDALAVDGGVAWTRHELE